MTEVPWQLVQLKAPPRQERQPAHSCEAGESLSRARRAQEHAHMGAHRLVVAAGGGNHLGSLRAIAQERPPWQPVRSHLHWARLLSDLASHG